MGEYSLKFIVLQRLACIAGQYQSRVKNCDDPNEKTGHHSVRCGECELWLCIKLHTYIQTIRNSFKAVFKHR